jgi:hypothetical protein
VEVVVSFRVVDTISLNVDDTSVCIVVVRVFKFSPVEVVPLDMLTAVVVVDKKSHPTKPINNKNIKT